MLAIGFFSGIMFAAWRAGKAGENPDHIYNLSVWIVISSLFGARLYYIVTHYSEFRVDNAGSVFTRIFLELKNMFWPISSNGQVGISGLVLYGGLILATAATAYYLKKHRLNVLLYMDILAPSIGLGEFFTRIGCFLNGCCFGTPTNSVCGVVFPEDSAAGFYFPNIPIHPAQLYNSLAGLSIFGLLLYFERYKKFKGFTALMFFVLYSVGRFTIDFFRYYEKGMTFCGLSHNQILSIIVFMVAGSLLVYYTIQTGKNAGGRIDANHQS